ncbi:unnamed protein product [Mycena citricolor]|uniref:BBC1/AIM3 cysteine proteinase-fold domain-containing protein n=1 Tax=Mycena citricolor TaxID=2018698 RepID=A0AAD2H9D6_9AGAR|nr:unnamed protein product [Mycena citricolor]
MTSASADPINRSADLATGKSTTSFAHYDLTTTSSNPRHVHRTMSDPSANPRPKPGSLRDRIAAFETKKPADGAPPPPPPGRSGPRAQWKPRPASPEGEATTGIGAAGAVGGSGGGMSVSDARESITKAGGSLKERMAALQGRGAFGVVPSPPADKKPVVSPPPSKAPEDGAEQESEHQALEDERAPPPRTAGDKPTHTASDPILSPALSDASEPPPAPIPDPGTDADADPEEAERERRAALAARMARLGGSRVGMGPPVFAPRPRARKRDSQGPGSELALPDTAASPPTPASPPLLPPAPLPPVPLSPPARDVPAISVPEPQTPPGHAQRGSLVGEADIVKTPTPATSSARETLSARGMPSPVGSVGIGEGDITSAIGGVRDGFSPDHSSASIEVDDGTQPEGRSLGDDGVEDADLADTREPVESPDVDVATDIASGMDRERHEAVEEQPPPPPPRRISVPPPAPVTAAPPRRTSLPPPPPVVSEPIQPTDLVSAEQEEADVDEVDEIPPPPPPRRTSVPPPPRAIPAVPQTAGSAADEEPPSPPARRISVPPPKRTSVPPPPRAVPAPPEPTHGEDEKPPSPPPRRISVPVPPRRTSVPPPPRAVPAAPDAEAVSDSQESYMMLDENEVDDDAGRADYPTEEEEVGDVFETMVTTGKGRPAHLDLLPNATSYRGPDGLLSPSSIVFEDRAESEIVSEDEGDPIDPVFHSPSRRGSMVDLRSAAAEDGPEDNAPPPVSPREERDTASPSSGQGNDEEDSEAARRRTIAERMAKLGGIRFGAAPVPRASHAVAREEEEKKAEEEDENEEEERARRARIAKKLAGMGGMRIGYGMAPGPVPTEEAENAEPAEDARGIEADEEPDVSPPAPSRASLPPVAVEQVNETSHDEEEIPPPIPSRSGRAVPAVVVPPQPEAEIDEEHEEPELPPPIPSRSHRPPVPATQPNTVAETDPTIEHASPSGEKPTSPSWELPSFGGGIDTTFPAFTAGSAATASTPLPRPQSSQQHPTPASPPVSMTADELIGVWGRVGVHLCEAATQLFERQTAGDGNFVSSALGMVPNARIGNTEKGWGYVVYTQSAAHPVQQTTDVLPGDIAVFFDCRFKGHKGLVGYSVSIGAGEPAVGIVSEYSASGKKRKVRVFHQPGKIEVGSFRLEDLKSGIVKFYRVLEA